MLHRKVSDASVRNVKAIGRIVYCNYIYILVIQFIFRLYPSKVSVNFFYCQFSLPSYNPSRGVCTGVLDHRNSRSRAAEKSCK